MYVKLERSSSLRLVNALLIDVYSSSEDLKTAGCQPNFFRVTTPDSVTAAMMRTYVQKSGTRYLTFVNGVSCSFARHWARKMSLGNRNTHSHRGKLLYTNGPAGGGGVRRHVREVISIESCLLARALAPACLAVVRRTAARGSRRP